METIGIKIDCGGILTKYEYPETYVEWDCAHIPRKKEFIILEGIISEEMAKYYGKERMQAYGQVVSVEWIKCRESFKIIPIITIDLTDI